MLRAAPLPKPCPRGRGESNQRTPSSAAAVPNQAGVNGQRRAGNWCLIQQFFGTPPVSPISDSASPLPPASSCLSFQLDINICRESSMCRMFRLPHRTCSKPAVGYQTSARTIGTKLLTHLFLARACRNHDILLVSFKRVWV